MSTPPTAESVAQVGAKGEQAMVKGPNGERRPADVVGCAVAVAKIATGEQEDVGYVSKNRRKGGVVGAQARMRTTDQDRRSEIASDAAKARWKKEAKMNDHIGGSLALLYEGKREAGLVDVKFLHKNLDEASPAQVEADLLKIQEAIQAGKTRNLDFGDLRWKKAD